eukprot:10035468-Lingulodinium_polyedra.AAC.1
MRNVSWPAGTVPGGKQRRHLRRRSATHPWGLPNGPGLERPALRRPSGAGRFFLPGRPGRLRRN